MKHSILPLLCCGASLLLACSGAPTASDSCENPAPGVICTVAGSGDNGYAGDGGPALRAHLSLPQDTLADGEGKLYVLDWNNHRIRVVLPDGTIQLVAGRGELGGTLDDPANSDFNHPTGILMDPGGKELLIAAWHNSKIRRLDIASGTIVDTCGDGRRAYFGDGGPALTASLDLPTSLAWDPAGNLVVMDQANQVLRRIGTDGVITRLAGRCVIDAPEPQGPGVCASDATPTVCPGTLMGKTTCGAPDTSCSSPCTPGYAGDEGLASEMRISQPFGQSADPGGRILYSPTGDLYFADPGNSLIRRIDTDGVVHRFAGLPPVDGRPQSGYSGDGGPALNAKLNNPVDLALGADGTLYFTDVYNHCVRAVDAGGTIRTVAGVCGKPGSSGDGGTADKALLKRPYGIELAGNTLYIADTGNNVIRKIVLP